MKRVHIISIGGSIMHSIAIMLAKKGYKVSGSDDVIYEPAFSELKHYNLLPEKFGWFPEKITKDIDYVILGMHAKKDNPELLKAQQLGLKIVSFPEFIMQFAEDKQRIVIAGSYGKTTTTAIIIYVLKKLGREFDYLVGGKVPGFDSNISIKEDSPVFVFEGDEYPASAVNYSPKLWIYKPHILVITGIERDHANIYKTDEEYYSVFEESIKNLPKAGTIIYNEKLTVVKNYIQKYLDKEKHYIIPYKALKSTTKKGQTIVKIGNKKGPVKLFGNHNLENLSAAYEVCRQLAVSPEEFLEAVKDFTGVEKRLQVVEKRSDFVKIVDFAHSPAKVRASVEAVKKAFSSFRPFTAVLELHTYSSVLPEYVVNYNNTLSPADRKIIIFSPENAKRKTGKLLPKELIKEVFGQDTEIYEKLSDVSLPKEGVLLIMSSGNLGGSK